MERLEAAIKKARGQQADDPRGTSRATGTRSSGPVLSGPVDEKWNALPALNINSQDLKRNRIMTLEAGREATAFDVLRTRTLRHMEEHGWRRLAITSPTAACGKSTLALNMAMSLGRQEKLRTIEFEMDMRRPSQERLLGLPKGPTRSGQPAVARLLTGAADFEDVAKRIGANLALVTSEVEMSNASDILLDVHIGEVLDEIEARYKPDIMLFDMPPTLMADDTLAFMRHVDGALIVAAAESSTVTEIDRCERELATQTNVMGVVLNKCRLASAEYTSYGDYNGY